MQKGTAIAVPFLCFSEKGLWAAWAALAVRFFVFARFFCLSPAYLSLLQAIRPPFSDSSFGNGLQRNSASAAAQFLSSLHLHLFCVLHLPASCFCPFLLFTKRRKPQRGKEGKGCPCLKVFCAPADAQPLIPAVPEAWQSLWLFDAAEQDVSEDFQPFPRSAAHYETGSDSAKLHKLPR